MLEDEKIDVSSPGNAWETVGLVWCALLSESGQLGINNQLIGLNFELLLHFAIVKRRGLYNVTSLLMIIYVTLKTASVLIALALLSIHILNSLSI